MARRKLHSDRYLRRKRTKRILGWFLFLLLLGGCIYAMNQPYFFFKEYRISGTETIAQEALTEDIDTYLHQTWMGIIPRKNIFFYGRTRLTSYLQESYPNIYRIDINTHVNELELAIQERDTHSLWCIEKEYEVKFDEECYFADQTGLWFMRAPYFSDNVFTKILIEPKVKGIIQGERYLSPTEFKNFFTFIKKLNTDYAIGIEKIFFRGQGDVVLRIDQIDNVVFRSPRVIYVNTKDSYERIHRNIGIVLNQEDFVNDFTERPQAFESIDVRFDGRIFYRFTPAS
jgi:hypothetical protein